MQLRRISALERERLEEEYAQVQETIRGLEELLGDERKVLTEIKKETRALRKKFGGERLTDISLDAHDISRAELEAHEQVVVTLSKAGYIKRIPATTYRNQHRGGKGVVSMNTREDDPVQHILVVDTHDTLLFFTNRGRVLKLTAYELRADTSRNARGVPVVNAIQLAPNEQVSALIAVDSLEHDDTYMVMGTRQGIVSRIALSQIATIRPSGLIMMRMRPDDELVGVRPARAGDDVIMVSEQGLAARFSLDEVTPRHRGTIGVKGMKLRTTDRKGKPLKSEDRVVAIDIIKAGSTGSLLVISRKGFGKLTSVSQYSQKGRGTQGLVTFDIRPRTGPIAVAEIVDDSKELYLVSEQAQVLRTSLSEIKTTIGRKSSGVTIFRLDKGDAVASIACVSDIESAVADAKAKNGSGGASGAKNGKSGASAAKSESNGVAGGAAQDDADAPEEEIPPAGGTQQLMFGDVHKNGKQEG